MACADGKLVAIQLGGLHKNWMALIHAMGRPDFADDPRFKERPDRIDNWSVLMEEFRPVFKSQLRDVWVERLLAADLPCSEVRDISEVLDGSEVRHSKLFEPREHPLAGPLTLMKRVARIDGSRGPEQPLPSLLGEHNDAILSELGYGAGDIQKLRDSNVLGQRPESAVA
jgi:crotonobetainyl-CoA:carnitine CoA-transferase CaiB-like acyl-CoA transferase